jgi:hypothetical protein
MCSLYVRKIDWKNIAQLGRGNFRIWFWYAELGFLGY